jgi:hypothetical protein
MDRREKEQRRAIVATETALNVEVKDGVITITRPGTEFRVTYRWQPVARQLLLTYSWIEPSITTPEVAAFRLAAQELAEATARARGWIA